MAAGLEAARPVPAPARPAVEAQAEAPGEAARELETQLIAELVAELNHSPDDPELAAAVNRFYRSRPGLAPLPALLLAVRRAPDPVGLALRLTTPPLDRAATTAAILVAALSERPAPAAAWARAAGVVGGAWRAAFLEEAYRRAVAGAVSGREELPAVTAMAESWLVELYAQGMVQEMLDAYDGLDPAVHALVESGTEGSVQTELDGISFGGRLRDLRLELALAQLLAGQLDRPRRLLARLPEPPADAGSPHDLWRRFAGRWVEPRVDDPFDLFSRLLDTRLRTAVGEPDPLGGVSGWTALGELALREGYTPLAPFAFSQAVAELDAQPAPAPDASGLPARVRAAARHLRARREQLAAVLREDVETLAEHVRAGLGADPAAATVARLLAAPSRADFRLLPMPPPEPPARFQATRPPPPKGASGGQPPRVAARPPRDMTLVRSDSDGKRTVAITVSNRYDPVGPNEPGAYWVLLSSQEKEKVGGALLPRRHAPELEGWERPLYTGLRVRRPYRILPASRLRLLAEDRLQVEVEIYPADSASPGSGAPDAAPRPPAPRDAGALDNAPRPPVRGFYLEIPLATLRQDSDGDGLTDLAEERLLTDPDRADTDADGVEDAVDPLPHVPRAGGEPARAGAASFALSLLLTGEGAGSEPRAQALTLPRGDDRTSYVVADRQLLAGVELCRRIIVLTSGEAAAAERKFGPFEKLAIELFFLDRARRRAYFAWSARTRRGALTLAQDQDGAWGAERVLPLGKAPGRPAPARAVGPRCPGSP